MIDLAITGVSTFARSDDKPDLELLERSLRRGLSDTTRLFVHTAGAALRDAACSPSDVHLLFGSMFGEITTAWAMLAQAYTENDASPARFRNSVHNTAPGLVSISTHNQKPTQAIAAGYDTVAMGLLEAHLLLQDGARDVLLVLAEERVPEELSLEFHYDKLAVAFVLTRPELAPNAKAFITNLRAEPSVARTQPEPDEHPLAGALTLAKAVREGQHTSLCVGISGPFIAGSLAGSRPALPAYWVDVTTGGPG